MLDLLDEIVRKNNDGDKTSWVGVQKDMASAGHDRSSEAWRALWRKEHDPEFAKQRERGIVMRDLRRQNALKLPDQLVILLKKKRSLEYLEYTLKKSRKDIIAEIVELQLHGYTGLTIWEENGVTYAQNRPKESRASIDPLDLSDLYDGEIIRFGVVSDTHMGSIYEALDELHKFYEYCEEEGLDTVFHVGDISDGWYTNRPAQIKELHAVGFTEQLDHIVDNYPHIEGIETYFITGNHDKTHMRNGFANIGVLIDRLRPDMTYLGHNYARISLSDKVDLSLIHPTDGSSQTLSLKLQKVVDKNEKRKADIMLMGHYHKSVGAKYKGSYAYLVPSFQHQTGFMEDNNLVSDVAGMIFTVKLYDGEIKSVTTEYVDFSE